ncbi:MAG TPA: LysM peptidoglycan-binding domain-containing protein [Candidatus Latescibacteria bacterium]|nr:LysM peptidoglycan-binding domain-containing protein [Candidatus Latescibacterota bacterium]
MWRPLLVPLCLALLPWGEVAVAGTHTVRAAENLSRIAGRYGVSVSDLKRWNGLASDRITIGQALTITRHGDTLVVRAGDTLSAIALRTGVSVAELRRLNRLRRDRIHVGQTLRLRPAQPTIRSANTGTVVVRRGDTLSEIAVAHRTTVAQLRRLNRLRGDGIRVGQTLRVASKPQSDDDEPQSYTVRPGDNLSLIGQRFDVGLVLLRRLNDLTGDRIHPGQKLRLRPTHTEEGTHVVQRGQTLSEIAVLRRIDLEELRRLNGIDGDLIRPGQRLHLRSTPSTIHVVESGDALWEIARAYGMAVADLKKLNGLSGSRIYPGQQLHLSTDSSHRLASYTVASGDNLSEIAQLHQMSVAELQKLNDMRGTVIHPGQVLRVRPLLGHARRLELSQIPWNDLFARVDGLPVFTADNGPYFGQRPKADRQKGSDYSEIHPRSPLKTYRQALKVWKSFERKVQGLGRLSDDLAGWHIVLDPGHGGIDPGAIVPTVDGAGRKLYVVEDEYVYDITLRSYVLLRLHGARVDITLLSPNHLIRHTAPPAQTFVHEMNEVFNSYTYNRRNRPSDWPMGTSRGLAERVRIAEEALHGSPKKRTIFLSFHADIDARAPEGAVVLYYESRNSRDSASRAFARALMPALGAGTRTRGQSLAVLRHNPAGVKVLVEVRNLAYVDNAWALRFEQLRHRDAEKIVKGVLDYARGKRVAGR